MSQSAAVSAAFCRDGKQAIQQCAEVGVHVLLLLKSQRRRLVVSALHKAYFGTHTKQPPQILSATPQIRLYGNAQVAVHALNGLVDRDGLLGVGRSLHVNLNAAAQGLRGRGDLAGEGHAKLAVLI